MESDYWSNSCQSGRLSHFQINMTYKIGVFGSAEGKLENSIPKAQQLGTILGEKNVIVINGATSGLPYEVALAAYQKGAKIWGYSQATDLETQKKFVSHDPSIYTKLFYIPKDYAFASNRKVCQKYRNVTSTAS